MEKRNIYQMYIQNNFRFGFYVHRNSWHPIKYAKVTAIEDVAEGRMIEGEPPYFGGRKYPPEHPKSGKTMGPRMVTLEADWIDEGKMTVNGGTFSFTQVDPKESKEFTDEETLSLIE